MEIAQTGAMRAVHWSLDPQEADILAGLLRAEGVDAWVLHRGQVALNWFDMLALGGFMVCVPAVQAGHGRGVVQDWRAGAYALDGDLPCPHCGRTDGLAADLRARGWALVLWWLSGLPLWWPRRRRRCAHCGQRSV